MDEDANVVTRHIGNCQICEGDFKVQAGRVVLHGYKRPGDGYAHGRCGGEGEPPYELSCEAIKPWLANVKTALVAIRERLADLEAGRVVWICEDVHRRDGRVQHVHLALGVTALDVWERAIETRIWDARSAARMMEADIARLERRIADWKPMPLREIDEQGRTQADRDAQAERRADRESKRAAKASKAAGVVAKKVEVVERRQAMLDDAGAKIRAAAEKGAPGEALDVLRELGKKKWRTTLDPSFMEAHRASQVRDGKIETFEFRHRVVDPRFVKALTWETDMNADEALLKLGLATVRASDGRIEYRSTLWEVR